MVYYKTFELYRWKMGCSPKVFKEYLKANDALASKEFCSEVNKKLMDEFFRGVKGSHTWIEWDNTCLLQAGVNIDPDNALLSMLTTHPQPGFGFLLGATAVGKQYISTKIYGMDVEFVRMVSELASAEEIIYHEEMKQDVVLLKSIAPHDVSEGHLEKIEEYRQGQLIPLLKEGESSINNSGRLICPRGFSLGKRLISP